LLVVATKTDIEDVSLYFNPKQPIPGLTIHSISRASASSISAPWGTLASSSLSQAECVILVRIFISTTKVLQDAENAIRELSGKDFMGERSVHDLYRYQ